jgi:glycolate oxidase FAD binding subunit
MQAAVDQATAPSDHPVLAQWADRVRAAAAAGQGLCLQGGGSKAFHGGVAKGEPFDTRAYAGIVEYEPSELVITARCGTPLTELEAALAARGQMLPFEPPHFGPQATLGGMLAASLAGPRRAQAGAVRDFVLGTRIMDGRGDVLSFGGQVMKNVAGYDVSRLMAGALGTLGLILEASFKVLPLPPAEATLRFELPQDRAITSLNQWAGRPLPISASAWCGDELTLRLSGAASAVRAAADHLGGERLPDDAATGFWRAAREQTHAFFHRDADIALWRLSLPSVTPPLALPGATFIEWGGSQRWIATHADAHTVREAATRAGGHATLFRGGDKSDGVFQLPAPALMDIHRRLKAAFDPQRVFNPGRLYPDL